MSCISISFSLKVFNYSFFSPMEKRFESKMNTKNKFRKKIRIWHLIVTKWKNDDRNNFLKCHIKHTFRVWKKNACFSRVFFLDPSFSFYQLLPVSRADSVIVFKYEFVYPFFLYSRANIKREMWYILFSLSLCTLCTFFCVSEYAIRMAVHYVVLFFLFLQPNWIFN